MDALTIPAYAADTLHETLTLHAPEDWHPRILSLAPRCCYGPKYHRGVITQLRDMSDCCVRGYSTVAYDHLLAAESMNARDSI